MILACGSRHRTHTHTPVRFVPSIVHIYVHSVCCYCVCSPSVNTVVHCRENARRFQQFNNVKESPLSYLIRLASIAFCIRIILDSHSLVPSLSSLSIALKRISQRQNIREKGNVDDDVETSRQQLFIIKKCECFRGETCISCVNHIEMSK